MNKTSNIKHQTLGQPKLSIIVPVYNVEQYLRKCVDSVLNQDYEDYEIILVDDGSTDSCPAICDEYAHTHYTLNGTQIKVIHQPNAGLSAARNSGLRIAKGEYICFVDSDDYWEENVLGALMAQVECEQLDVLHFDYQNVNEKYEVYEPNKTPRYIDKGTTVVDGEKYLNTRMGYACYAVMYIIRRGIVPLFTEGIHFEDVDWLPRMMLQAKRVNSTTKMVYNYLVRQGSITKTQGNKVKIRKNLEDRITIIAHYRKFREQYPNCLWLRDMQSNMACGVLTTIAREFYAERKKYFESLNELKVIPLSMADQGKTYKRRAQIINLFGMRIYCAIMHLI